MKVPAHVSLLDIAASEMVQDKGCLWVGGRLVIREMFLLSTIELTEVVPPEQADEPHPTLKLGGKPIYQNNYQDPGLLILYGPDESQAVAVFEFQFEG